MMKNSLQTLLTATLLALTATPVYAFTMIPWSQEPWHPLATLGFGALTTSDAGSSKTFPIQNPTTDEFYQYTSNKSYQTFELGEIFLGGEQRINPSWWLQLGVDYTQSTSVTTNGTLVQGADVSSQSIYSYQYSILARQLLLEAKLLHTWKEYYHPYLLAGLGASFNKAYNFSTTIPFNMSFTRQYHDSTNTSFSYAFGLGIDMDVTQKMRLGMAYRFVNLGQAALGSAYIDSTSVSGSLSQTSLYAHEGLINLTYLA